MAKRNFKWILLCSHFIPCLLGDLALVPGVTSSPVSLLLFYFARSVSKLFELHVWTEQPLSNGREGKEKLQHQVRNCQVDIPRRLSPAS